MAKFGPINIFILVFDTEAMSFIESDVIMPPDRTFIGSNYSNLIATWWNYIITLNGMPPKLSGMFLFLLGNVEGVNPPLPAQPQIGIFNDSAVFFPVLCEIYAQADFPNLDTEIKRRNKMQTALASPKILRAHISDGTHDIKLDGTGQLSKYYAESPDFMFDVPGGAGTLANKFKPPMKPGSSRAVAGGYYLLLKPPNKPATYDIEFEGERHDGYHTQAKYNIKFT